MSEETTEKEERKYFTYMVRCADGSLYTGFTVDDVHRRVAVHNSGKGARYTRSRLPVFWRGIVSGEGSMRPVRWNTV